MIMHACHSSDAKFKDFVISIMEYLSAVRREDEFIDIQETARKEFQGSGEFMVTMAVPAKISLPRSLRL
jgi:hypothetical protein